MSSPEDARRRLYSKLDLIEETYEANKPAFEARRAATEYWCTGTMTLTSVVINTGIKINNLEFKDFPEVLKFKSTSWGLGIGYGTSFGTGVFSYKPKTLNGMKVKIEIAFVFVAGGVIQTSFWEDRSWSARWTLWRRRCLLRRRQVLDGISADRSAGVLNAITSSPEENEGAEAPSLTQLATVSAVMPAMTVSAMMARPLMMVALELRTLVPPVVARSGVAIGAICAGTPVAAAPGIADVTHLVDTGRLACDVAGLRKPVRHRRRRAWHQGCASQGGQSNNSKLDIH